MRLVNHSFYIQTVASPHGEVKMSTEETEEVGEAEEEEIPTIYVGSKPLMRYVMAAMSIFLDENPDKIEIAARGRAISRAVDTAEVLRTRYLKGILKLENVEIGTDEVEDQETGEIDRVSSMTVSLKKVRALPAEKAEELKGKV